MEYKLTVILLAVTILECNGQLNILGGILSNARERVQSGAEGIAGAVLGGLNLNVGGHLGINRHNRPQDVPQKGPDQTVIIVVEEPNQNNYGPPPLPDNHGPPPPPPHHGHGPPPPPHHGHGPPPRPPHHGHGPPPPPHHHHGPPPQHNHGPPPPPPHHNQGPHHGPPHHHHHHERPHGDPRPPGPGYNDQNQGPYNENANNQNNQNNENNLFGNNQNMGPYDKNDKNYNNNNYQPNPQDNQGHNENNNQQITNAPNTKPFYSNPTTEYIRTTESTKTSPPPKNDESNKITGTTSDDLPLFVPLNPGEYVYGGDKINITAPKRDTEKTKPVESDDDDDFAIDIRLKN